MSSISPGPDYGDHLEEACLYALQVLPASQIPVFEAHLSSCVECRREIETLRPVIASFVSSPTDVLRPSVSLRKRLFQRISGESCSELLALSAALSAKPEWEGVSEGISCQLLAVDEETDRVTMLVRLAPGIDYPPHRHADTEELYLLQGELLINDKKLRAGDFARAEPGSLHHRIRTETGCTCVLLTSARDEIW